jgi:hypothetical protein
MGNIQEIQQIVLLQKPSWRKIVKKIMKIGVMKNANSQKCSLKRNHTRNAIEFHQTARREENKIYTRKKKDYNEDKFKELEYLKLMNKGKGFC